MKSSIFKILYIGVFVSIISACNLKDRQLRPVLAEADSLLICNRDSEAYALLEPIKLNLFEVDDDTYALYCTLLLQAQDRCDVPLVDSLGVGAYLYYRDNKEDYYHAGLAHYYMGKVAFVNRDYSSTLYIEKQAQALFDTILCDRYSFLAREREAIAHIQRYSMRLAVGRLKEALQIAERINNPIYISSTLIRIAECYYSLHEPDSMIACISDERVIPSSLSYMLLSGAYVKEGKWDLALAYSDTSIMYASEEYDDIVSEMIDKAAFLAGMGDYKACNAILDTITPRNYYEELSYTRSRIIANMQRRNDEQQLSYFYRYDAMSDSVLINSNKLEVENIDRMLNEHRELTASRDAIVQRFFNFIVSVIIIFLVLSLVTIRLKWQRDNISHRNAELEAHKAQIMRQLIEETLKNRDISKQLEVLANSQKEEAQTTEDKILRKNICENISRGLLKLNEDAKADDKYAFIIEQIEYIYPMMSNAMLSRYSNLTSYDIAVCEMTRVGFTAITIAECLFKSVNTIRTRQRLIREQIAKQEGNENMQWNDLWHIVERQRKRL